MKKIVCLCTKIVIILTLIIFSYITYNAINFTSMLKYVNGININLSYIYLGTSILIFLLALLVFKIINRSSAKQKKFLKYLFIFILIIMQLIIFLDIKPIFFTDAFMITDQGKSLALGFDKVVDYVSSNYWYYYSNNNLCVLIIILLTKIFNLFNLANSNWYLILFNIIMIDLSIFFAYKTAKKIKNEDFSLKVLFLCILNPLNYIYILWPYTNTFSWLFMIGIIYFSLLLKECQKIDIKFICYIIIIGIFSSIGFLLRPTIIIPIIALIITVFLYYVFYSKKAIKILKTHFMKLFLSVILILTSISLSYFGIKSILNQFYNDYSKNLPFTYYLMLGVHGNGTVNQADIDYTFNFSTKKEMINANINEIKKTINEYGISKTINHYINKFNVNWNSSFSNFRVDGISQSSHIYKYLVGDKNDGFVIYCQAFRILIYFLLCLSLVKQLKKDKLDYNIIFIITIFGALLFHTFWEVKNEYSYPFILFIIILAADIINDFSYKKNTKNFKNLNLLFIFFAIFTFITFNLFYEKFVKTPLIMNEYQIKADFDYLIYVDNVANNHEKIIQEFYANDNFNHITLYVTKLNDKKTNYSIKILKNGKDIENYSITSDDIIDNHIDLNIDTQNINKKQKYEIIISSDGNLDSIGWGYRLSHHNNYYDGNLYIDNKKYESDLAIKVYNQYKGNYFTAKQYFIIFLILILLEYIVIKKQNIK